MQHGLLAGRYAGVGGDALQFDAFGFHFYLSDDLFHGFVPPFATTPTSLR